MKRFLGVIVLLCLLSGFGYAGSIPISGTIQLPNGSKLNGRIRFTLSYSAARDTSNNNITVAQQVEFNVANGNLPGTARIVPNDVLQPANTWYTAEYFNSFGTRIATNLFYVAGASFNIGQAQPTVVTSSNISFVNNFGWTDDGAVVRLTTAADQVVVGANTTDASIGQGKLFAING